jgi:hypothetical protein
MIYVPMMFSLVVSLRSVYISKAYHTQKRILPFLAMITKIILQRPQFVNIDAVVSKDQFSL